MKKLIICAICAICGLTTANAQKFGHVNTQEIIQAMPEFVKAQSELKSLQEQYEADLKSMQEELQKILEQIQSGIGELAQMIGSATDTSSEIAQNIGQMA